MKTKIKISVSSVKYGNQNPEGTNPDLYINEKSAYTQGAENQVFTYEKETDRFLCALMEEDEDIIASSDMTGLETFERLDKKIAKEELKLEDSVSVITNAIQDLVDINTSEGKKNRPPVSYLCLYMEGDYGVCVNNGLQSAYYYDSINMISMTPASENPDKLIKMGIISDEQAELVRKDIIKSASHINVSKMIRLVNDGIFVLMNSSMSGYFDELDVENCIETLRNPEQIGNFLMGEAINTDQDKDYSVTVIKIETVQNKEIPKKKIPVTKPQGKGAQGKGQNNKKEPGASSAQQMDSSQTIKVPNIKDKKFAPDSDIHDKNAVHEDVGLTRKIEPVSKKMKSKTHYLLTYFSSRIFTIIVIIAVLSGVVIGLVNLASLVFSDNVVPPAYTDKKDTTTKGTVKTSETTDKVETTTEGTASVTTAKEPEYTMPNITESEIIHTVKSGETLSHIAILYYDDQSKYSLIMEANNITNPGSLQIGQQLKIPALPKTSETTSGN